MTLLDLSPEEASRRIAIERVREALAAIPRVQARADPEALHDLRVALRRLRSVLRSWKEPLRGSLSRKRRARLRELAGATGAARDAEVQGAWARALLDESMEPEERVAVEYLRDHWAAEEERAFATVTAEVLPRLAELLPRVERDLSRYAVEHVVFAADPAAATVEPLLAALAQDEMAALARCLRRVSSIDDEAIAHEARIHGKRLRYLLEPFRDARPDVDAAVKTLKTLQELLGDLNDRAVRTSQIMAALEALATTHVRGLAREAQGDWRPLEEGVRPGEVQPGLLAVLRREGLGKTQTFDALLGDWIGGPGLPALEAAIGALAVPTRPDSTALPTEIERKYLLRGLPPRALEGASMRIEQGYLPGERLIERVRRVEDAEGERYVRTVKLGSGVTRVEVEEACTREVFLKLWALTKGRRVKKVRHAVEHGGLTWEIDAFTDRRLVLAEVELPHEETEVVFPDWLAPFVVREVTDEAEFVNARLAK